MQALAKRMTMIDGIVSFTFILTLHNSDGVSTGCPQMLYIDLESTVTSRS